jgi:V-type H+-transporting ATPase subunit a
MIETIEFVLGTISNTASYLRLWALSLAHSQLAKVFFDQVLVPFMSSGSVVGCFIAFFVFMSATTAVLMMMDVMECGLHTLRLHWVEFQNKFYKGVGIPFTPIKVSEILTAKHDDKNRNLGAE